jgi:hypothetical protein
MFWHERFMVEVPDELIQYIMPWLNDLKLKVDNLGDKTGPSRRSVVEAFEYLARVAVQDALELSDRFPNHPVHVFLNGSEAYKCV